MPKTPSPISELKASLSFDADQTAPLSKAEAAKLSRKYRRGDLAARDRMVMSCSFYVLKIANQLQLGNLPLEDRVAEGFRGLLHACEKYDPKFKVNFSTYATFWIRQHIQRAAEENKIVKIPSHTQDRVKEYERRANELAVDGPLPDANAICESIGYTNGSAEAIQRAMAASETIFLLTRKGTTWTGTTDSDSCHCDAVIERTERKKAVNRVRRAIGRLVPRHREVIRRRSRGETFDEIAADFGVSRERIRQIERIAMKKLSKYLGGGEELAMSVSQAMKETEW